MKIFIHITVFIFLAVTAKGQTEPINLKELGLRGRIKKITLYEYYSNPKETEVDSFRKPGKTEIMIFGEKGNEQSDVDFTPDGIEGNKTLINYEDKDKITAKLFYQKKLMLNFVFKYDSTGKRVNFEEYDSPNAVLVRVTYKYDGNGNLIEDDTYDSLNGNSKTIYSYNSGNQITETNISYEGSQGVDKTLFKYSTEGYLIETVSRGDIVDISDGTTIVKYTNFDKYGNWLLANSEQIYKIPLLHNLNHHKTIIKRVITYFD